MGRIYVSLDLETTGLTERDAILEIGAVKFRDDEVLDTWSSFVNPGRSIPHKITRLTGISDHDVDSAPTFHSVAAPLARFVGENPIIGHNIQFDLSMLQRAGYTALSPSLDTFDLACVLMPYASRYSLGKLMEQLGIDFPTRHRALDDAAATHKLFLALLDRAGRLDQKIIQEIGKIAERADWALKFAFQDALRGRTRTAFSGGSIGAQLAAKGLVEDETLGMLFSRDREDKPLKPAATKTPLDVDGIASLLEGGGAFDQKFAGFEHRPQQVQMTRAVANAFNDGATLLAEAGTGTGKSIAYLLPAIYFAVQNEQRVVISTNTINLQDQLFVKDIPDLKKILTFEFKAALLKGRSNYLCVRRLDVLRRTPRPTRDEARVLAKVLAWLPSTATGDSAELTLVGAENAVWSRLASDPDYCTMERCGQRSDKCYFFRARERAESAHLLIVNHALLLSDVAMDNRVLPEFKYLIIDEAHHLEARATDALSFAASRTTLELLLRALSHERGGLLGNLAGALRGSDAPPRVKTSVQDLLNGAADNVERAVRGVYDFFNALEDFISHLDLGPGEAESAYDRQIRLTASRRLAPAWSDIEIVGDDFCGRLLAVREVLEKIYGAWEELSDNEVPSYAELFQDIAANMRRVSETRLQIESFVSKPQSGGIYWIEINKNKGDISLHAAPLYVGDLLQKRLFAGKEANILTSATMTVDNKFTFIKSRLGIGDWADELQVGSPFNYGKAAMMFVPTDLPEPGAPGYQKAVESTLVDLFRATGGRALALFTSLSQLNTTYRAISRPLEEDDVIVIAQNQDGSRRQVLETFKTQDRTVLLGTRSFWEGIDVVGEALSCLVIARLPFSVPSDPVFAARSETFEDSFAQYAVPEAVLRFRQGFGRLIRSQKDRGLVVVLDRRVLSKNYGRIFIESLPPVGKYQGPLKELPGFAGKFLNGS